MCVCVYVYMYIYMCVCVCVCMNIHICIYIHTYSPQCPLQNLSALTHRLLRRQGELKPSNLPRGFTEFTREVISAPGYLPLWGNSKFYLRVRSLPGLTRNPPFSPVLETTARPTVHPIRT